MIVAIGYVDVAAAIDGDTIGFVEGSSCRRAAIAGITRLAAARDGCDNTRSPVDAADAVVERVREIEIAGGVKTDIERAVQLRLYRRSAIAGKAALAGP